MQKLYKKLGTSGGLSIALGIVILVVGMACGIMMIVTGASVLRSRNKLTF